MKCSFCSNPIKQGTGKLFVYTDGKMQYLCSRKCEVHSTKLNHQPRDLRWTGAGRKELGKVDKKEVAKKEVAKK